MNLFKIFTTTHYTFEGKKDNEEVLLFLRKHWFVLANQITLVIIGTILPFLIFVMFGAVLAKYELVMAFVLLWIISYMFLWFTLFYHITMYMLETWTITNLRIIDSKQIGFFSREVAEINLERVQDVSFSIKGAMPTMLDFGDIEVQSAGAEKKFHFQSVPKAQQVKDRIVEITMQAKGQDLHTANSTPPTTITTPTPPPTNLPQ